MSCLGLGKKPAPMTPKPNLGEPVSQIEHKKTPQPPKITPEEYELLVVEIANRIKNLAYMNAEEFSRRCLDVHHLDLMLEESKQNAEFRFNYSLTLIGNDLREIVGGIRRKREDEASAKVAALNSNGRK